MKKTFVASLITAAATFVFLPIAIMLGLFEGLMSLFGGYVNIGSIMLTLMFISTLVVFILSTIIACKKGETGKGLAITALVFKAILALSTLVYAIMAMILVGLNSPEIFFMSILPFIFVAAASSVGFAFTLTDLVKKA